MQQYRLSLRVRRPRRRLPRQVRLHCLVTAAMERLDLPVDEAFERPERLTEGLRMLSDD